MCYSRRMELLSVDTSNEKRHPFFKGRSNASHYESGIKYMAKFKMIAVDQTEPHIDLNRIWTSADASCLAKSKAIKCRQITWCGVGKVMQKTKPIRVPARRKDSCLTFERTVSRFTYRSCDSHYHFVCEVSDSVNWSVYILALSL